MRKEIGTALVLAALGVAFPLFGVALVAALVGLGGLWCALEALHRLRG